MNRKFIILVGDGMGDYPLDELGGKTPLEAARTPNLDRMARAGRVGTVRTVPEGMEPGSDVANMSLLGYDPAVYHTGRSPLEAASMGISLKPDETAFRCNLVFLDADGSGRQTMGDYSAGHITTTESHRLIAALQEATSGTPLRLYPGISYRHLLVWPAGPYNLDTTPPHDIPGLPVFEYQQVYRENPVLWVFMQDAARLLSDHPVNLSRTAGGKRPANAVWLWGQGRAPRMPTLKERFGLTGAMISAVDLLKGLGVYAGLDPIIVPGATGYLDTNYEGKVAAALDALRHKDLVFVHIEAPDEASHEGSLEKKIEAIEAFDERVAGPLSEGARQFESVSMLVVTDHFTPISKRTHTADPAPFLLIGELNAAGTPAISGASYNERTADASGWRLDNGVELFTLLAGRKEKTAAHQER